MISLGLTAEQKARRLKGIGGSDGGAIVAGGDEWVRLWREKTGRQPGPNLDDVLAVQMGNATEGFNAFWYTKMTGRVVSHRNSFVQHPSIPYLFANLDGMTTTSAGHLAYIDFKHVGRAGDQMTLRYTAQGTHCAAVVSAVRREPVDWFCLSTFIGNSKWELTEVEIDPFFQQDYLDKCAEFWGYVERDEEPPASEPLPVPLPRRLRTISLEDVDQAAWPNWSGELIGLIRTFAETEPAAKKHAIVREEIKALVPEDVGTITRGRFKYARDKAGAVRMSLKKMEDDG